MIFFPIICASLFIAIPRIISAAPVSEPLVIDNNRSVGRSVEISPSLGLAWPGHYDEEIAWNEGETKSKDEESGNYEDNWDNSGPIVYRKGQVVHIERTQDFNNNNNQPPGQEIEVERPPQSGEDEGSNYDINSGINYYYVDNPSIGETESEDKGSNYDKNSGINININNPTSGSQPMDGCMGAACECPPGMSGVQPFCQPE